MKCDERLFVSRFLLFLFFENVYFLLHYFVKSKKNWDALYLIFNATFLNLIKTLCYIQTKLDWRNCLCNDEYNKKKHEFIFLEVPVNTIFLIIKNRNITLKNRYLHLTYFLDRYVCRSLTYVFCKKTWKYRSDFVDISILFPCHLPVKIFN